MLYIVCKRVCNRAQLDPFKVKKALIGQELVHGSYKGGSNGHGSKEGVSHPLLVVIFFQIFLEARSAFLKGRLKAKQGMANPCYPFIFHDLSPLSLGKIVY